MNVCTKQQRLAELARESPQSVFTSLDTLDKGHLRAMLDRRVGRRSWGRLHGWAFSQPFSAKGAAIP